MFYLPLEQLQFDDAEFNAEDYDSIQRVGDGTKMGDPTKTGQFGLGFNSVYHLTDTPCFISGSDFVMFDPHETHLAADQEIPVKAAELARSCPDQVRHLATSPPYLPHMCTFRGRPCLL